MNDIRLQREKLYCKYTKKKLNRYIVIKRICQYNLLYALDELEERVNKR